MRRKTRVALIVLIILAVPLTIMSGVLGSVVELPLEVKRLAWPLLLLVAVALVALAVWQFWLQAGTEPSAADTRENRRIMLNRVTAKWIAGFLENPLYYDEQLLPLPLRERVGSRYDPAPDDPLEPAWSLPPDTRIQEVFDQARGQLLILGEPGAGKTTLLLELARNLLQRARNHEEALIPVVLTLSSWATKQLPFEQWVIEELKTKYQITTEIGQAWVRDNQLLLLLDGLDEVAPHAQPDCMQAVNSYIRQAHRSLVVCSRTKEYREQKERLALRTTVAIQPFWSQQVGTYLSALGEEVDGLRLALQRSKPLRRLATTPLLLKVLILAYHGKSAQDLLPLVNTAPTDQQPRLFHDYVERMLQREGPRMRASEQQTRRWLTWLARQMTQHSLTEFYLTNLRPAWLPTKRSQSLYRVLGVLLYGLVFGLLGGLSGWLGGGLINESVFGLSARPVLGLVIGLVFGPVFGLLAGWRITAFDPRGIVKLPWKDIRLGLVFGPVLVLALELLCGLVGLFFHDPVSGLGLGLGFSLVLVMTFMLGFGGSLFMLDVTVLVMLVSGLAFEWVSGLWNPLIYGLIFVLFFVWAIGSVGSEGDDLFPLLVDGTKYLQSYGLRYFLWRSGATPWRYVAFLDDAADQLLLRKIGGGYVFRHPLLQEYFASSDVVPPHHPPFHAEAHSV